MAAAAPSRRLLLLLLVLNLLTSSTSTAPYDPPTVPELMDRFGLPRALLPKTARRYLLHSDGSFELFLDDGCEVEAGPTAFFTTSGSPGVYYLLAPYHR
ncbi:hypothetical protein ZWY2020_037824 [Hordeum vulgare]|nr:hypothetical protein ZWY2020_037824 [Hordeum vulgare]